MPSKILRFPAVRELTGLGRTAIYDRIAQGTFPRPVPLGPRAVGFLADEVEAWISDRAAERDATEVPRPRA